MKRPSGVKPRDLDDSEVRNELRNLWRTREDTFLNGSKQSLAEHTKRMLQLEEEFGRRFPKETLPAAARTRAGSRAKRATRGTKRVPQASAARR